MRGSDTLFRIGEEEFLILAPATSSMGAYELAESLRTDMPRKSLASLTGHTFSAGISELHNDDTADTWLIRADKALYHARQQGRDRVVLTIETSPSTAPGFEQEGSST